jgi:hypothetical protein
VAVGREKHAFRLGQERLLRYQLFDQDFCHRFVVGPVKQPAKQIHADSQRQDGRDQAGHRQDRFGDDRVTIPPVGNRPALLLERIALLVNVGVLRFDLLVQFDVILAALGVGFDEPLCGVDHLLVIGFNQPVLLRLAVCTLTREFDQSLVAGATADGRQEDENWRLPNWRRPIAILHGNPSKGSEGGTEAAGKIGGGGPLERAA